MSQSIKYLARSFLCVLLKLCSISVVLPTEVKVIDESGNVVPVGTPGELCTRAYSSMLCYWNDEEKTNELISKDRWLHSGYVY